MLVRRMGEARVAVETTPAIWKSYFDAGRLEAKHEANAADIRILDVPVPHVYFEYTVLGYFRKGLALTGASGVTTQR
jgi:hypothetical protein